MSKQAFNCIRCILDCYQRRIVMILLPWEQFLGNKNILDMIQNILTTTCVYIYAPSHKPRTVKMQRVEMFDWRSWYFYAVLH